MTNVPMSPAMVPASELDEIRELLEQRSAICFDASRERFFSTRVNQFLSENGESSAAGLLSRIRNSSLEYDRFLQSLLTQETSFFRYPDVFRVLQTVVLPGLQARKMWDNPRTLRVWSAGCSTGEEPYSIGMTILDVLQLPDAWEIEILATDISRDALRIAEQGIYADRSLAGLLPEQLKTHFAPSGAGQQVKPRLRKLISFRQMNLAQSVYVGRMDFIFCMNVLMYFSEERRNSLLQSFYDTLTPGGYFFLGHAESLKSSAVKFETAVCGDFQYYVKPAGASREPAVFGKDS